MSFATYANEIITGVIGLTVGGGFAGIAKAKAEARLRDAEARAVGLKSAPEVADLSIATMIRVNEQLTEDYVRMKAERDDYYSKLTVMREDFAALEERLESVQGDLQSAHDAMGALRYQLDELARPHTNERTPS